MRLEQRRGHQQRVIQILQRRDRVLRPGVQHRLRRRFHRRPLRGRHRPDYGYTTRKKRGDGLELVVNANWEVVEVAEPSATHEVRLELDWTE